MPWPPNQPAREEMDDQDKYFWDAIVARGRMASEATRQTLAMVYERAVGPEKALFDGDLVAGWDGVERDSPYLDPAEHAIPYGQLLHSPELAWHIANLGALTRLRSERDDTFSHSDREWVSQVLYVETGITYFQRIHVGDGLGVGIRPEAIDALHEGREWDLTEDERLLTAFIRAVLNRTMTVELWDAMEVRIGTCGAVDYSILICVHMLVSTLTRALNFYPEYGRKGVDRVVQAYKDGVLEVPAYGPNQPDKWVEQWGVRSLLGSE